MKLAHLTLAGLAIFLFGIVFGHVLATTAANVTGGTIESPAGVNAATGTLPMPQSRIGESQIVVSKDNVVLEIPDASWSTFTATKSMVPFLDKGSYAIEVTPTSAQDLKPGDIISYELGGISIIHRIIATGYDSQGWYAIVKGDNNPSPDPFKVRFSQVQHVLVAIIY